MGERGDPRSPRSSLGDGDMPRTITSSMLHGGPLRIWSAITDPDHRRAWSPLVFLDNPCQLGETECTFAIQGITRPIRTPARVDQFDKPRAFAWSRSEEHTSELQSLMRISYAVFCLKQKKKRITQYETDPAMTVQQNTLERHTAA